MEQGSDRDAFDETGFLQDLATLRPQALRSKYKREASSHAAMKRRCGDGSFELDPEWADFRSFLRDMGPHPSSDATLDRIDPSVRRYGPGLCRWATKTEQTVNRRNTVWLELSGEKVRLQEFAERLGAPYSTIHAAIARGETPEAIFRRYASDAHSEVEFRPAWIENDDALRSFQAKHRSWLRLVRRDRRSSADPEVYAAIVASEALYNARRRLRAAGFDEVTPDEFQQFRERFVRELRISDHAVTWIKHALRSLAQRNVKLAGRLLPRHGQWEDVRLFEKWLVPPPEDA